MDHATTHRAASYTRKPAAYSDHIAEELCRYERHLRDVRGLAEGSCRQRTRIAGRLLHKQFAERPINISELRAEDVRHFLASQLDARRTPSNASQLASALRSYFRFRARIGGGGSNREQTRFGKATNLSTYDQAHHRDASIAGRRRHQCHRTLART